MTKPRDIGKGSPGVPKKTSPRACDWQGCGKIFMGKNSAHLCPECRPLADKARGAAKNAATIKKYQEDPEFRAKYRETQREYARAGGDRRKKVRKYEKQLDAKGEILKAFAESDGNCELCGKPNVTGAGVQMALAIDHCHISNKFRGLLCNRHNMMLGYAQDNKELLRRAADYIGRYEQKCLAEMSATIGVVAVDQTGTDPE